MIYTSNYTNCIGKDNAVSISGDRGREANFYGLYYDRLAPKRDFFDAWKDNIGNFTETDNNRFYVKSYVRQILLPLNPERVYEDLDRCILVCYEKNNEFCHRHIVAAWLEDQLKIEVPEIAYTEENKMIELKRPDYIKEMYEVEKLLIKKNYKRF